MSRKLLCKSELLQWYSLHDQLQFVWLSSIVDVMSLRNFWRNIAYQLVLASTPDTVSIDDLASLADKILDVTPPQHSLAAISTLPESSARKEIDDLRLHLNNLTTQLTSFVSHLQLLSRYRSRSRSRGRCPTRSGSRNFSSFSTSPGPFCWYHQQFGSAARKCNPPCSFKASASPQQSENFQAKD